MMKHILDFLIRIKKLNKELAEKGKIVVSGRVNRKYFYKRIDCTDKTEGG